MTTNPSTISDTVTAPRGDFASLRAAWQKLYNGSDAAFRAFLLEPTAEREAFFNSLPASLSRLGRSLLVTLNPE